MMRTSPPLRSVGEQVDLNTSPWTYRGTVTEEPIDVGDPAGAVQQGLLSLQPTAWMRLGVVKPPDPISVPVTVKGGIIDGVQQYRTKSVAVHPPVVATSGLVVKGLGDYWQGRRITITNRSDKLVRFTNENAEVPEPARMRFAGGDDVELVYGQSATFLYSQGKDPRWLSTAVGAWAVGSTFAWPTQTIPFGYLLCDGKAFKTSQYPLLAQKLGKARVPDLRGRYVVGSDPGTGAAMPGLTLRKYLSTGGVDTQLLDDDHLPLHNHTISDSFAFFGGDTQWKDNLGALIKFRTGVDFNDFGDTLGPDPIITTTQFSASVSFSLGALEPWLSPNFPLDQNMEYQALNYVIKAF